MRNNGKTFERVIRKAFESVQGVSVDRIPDQTARNKGAKNICDFIVYRYPNQYYIECKTVHGNRLPFSNISETQWEGLLKKSTIEGVFAGVICWWVDKDTTKFIPIQVLEYMRDRNRLKSIDYKTPQCCPPCYGAPIEIKGKKKRVFFDYDMEEFLNEFV